jgi:hypothetical protein
LGLGRDWSLAWDREDKEEEGVGIFIWEIRGMDRGRMPKVNLEGIEKIMIDV